jgi:pyruvate formate lyase activating enzyme
VNTAVREGGAAGHATVLNIQRMSTEDGPGLRTTVFFKGCSLECTWCHNPEAVSPKPELVWHENRCIGAGACYEACGENAIRRLAHGIEIDRERCTLCGDCVERCPSLAMEMLGVRWQLDDLVHEVSKDRSYFETSGGGVTVSGGEPALRVPFVVAFLDRCRELGLHTAVDTCGMCSTPSLIELASHADLVLYDIKEIDPGLHARFTGQSNEQILAGLSALAGHMRTHALPAELWIRTPLIPNATARADNVYAIGALISRDLTDVVSRWELCAFNNLATDKYRRLGRAWEFAGVELITASELARFAGIARDSGVDPEKISVTGRSRMQCRPEETNGAGA